MEIQKVNAGFMSQEGIMCLHITSTPKISKLNVDLGHIEQLFHQNVLARFGDLGDPNHQNPEQ